MKLLEGKVAIVTGASRGIGKEIAREFAQNGADVAITYARSEKEAKEIEKELKDFGVRAKAYQSDASDFEQCQSLAKKVIEDFSKIDILVNNAGITKDALLLRMSEEDFDKVIQTNLKSVFSMTKAVQSYMIKQREGSIVNISSVVGVQGNAGQANYAASKAGILGFTKSVAIELGSRGVRCNAIAPGFIETEMTQELKAEVVEQWKKAIPLKRAGSVQDVAKACLFLSSNLSQYITGQTLRVDGGMITA